MPCMTAFLLVTREWKLVTALIQRLIATPRLLIAAIASSALMGAQLWLFMWAPLNGYSLDVSLVYFLLPLSMVLTGRIVYGERLSYLQKVAVFFATLGVFNELYQVVVFPGATLLVVIGYPIYFILRKRIKTDNLVGSGWT